MCSTSFPGSFFSVSGTRLPCALFTAGVQERFPFEWKNRFFPVGNQMEQVFPQKLFRKKMEYLQRYSSFFVFTGITGKSLYNLLYHTSTMLLNKRFRSRMSSFFMFECQYTVFILNRRNVY